MKTTIRTLAVLLVIAAGTQAMAQKGDVKTLFNSKIGSSGGYGAATNSFTKIRGEFANINGIYGGWFINRKLLVGLAGAATTNRLHVPAQYSTDPTRNRIYQYGQFGLMTEYVIGSNKPVHLVVQAFGGAGFTMQYSSRELHNGDDDISDENWFVVAEPGVQLEFNLFRWMRFSPGVSYRASFGSDGRGMKDEDVRGVSYNATLKFGKF